MWTCSYPEELYHHGILGMHWGHHKLQSQEISKAKNRLKTAKENAKLATNDYYKKTWYGLKPDYEAYNNLTKVTSKIDDAKNELTDAKMRERLNNQSHKSQHQLNVEQKYKEQGMTKSDAELAAYKRVRTEKILGTTAGLTMAAIGAYVAYKQYDKNVDKIIKSGTMLQNIGTNSNKGVEDAFYASKNWLDNIKYRGLYATQLEQQGAATVHEIKIGVNKNLKLASEKSATKVLDELVKTNPEYKKTLENELRNLGGQMVVPKQSDLLQESLAKLKSGKVDSKVYESLNLVLTDHSTETAKRTSKEFYEAMKKHGYDAIKDINDNKYSGYKSINPIIVFNGGSKTAVNSVRQLGEAEIQKNFAIGMGDVTTREFVKQGAPYTLAILGLTRLSKKNNKKVAVRK